MASETRARRIGNSLGVIIPRRVFPLSENEPLSLRVSPGGVLEVVRRQTHDYEALVRDFADAARPRLGREVRALVLYGSVARGEARQDPSSPSDVDLFAIVRDPRVGEALDSIAFEVSARHGYIPVTVLSWTLGDYRREARRRNPFLSELRAGRLLHGTL